MIRSPFAVFLSALTLPTTTLVLSVGLGAGRVHAQPSAGQITAQLCRNRPAAQCALIETAINDLLSGEKTREEVEAEFCAQVPERACTQAGNRLDRLLERYPELAGGAAEDPPKEDLAEEEAEEPQDTADTDGNESAEGDPATDTAEEATTAPAEVAQVAVDALADAGDQPAAVVTEEIAADQAASSTRAQTDAGPSVWVGILGLAGADAAVGDVLPNGDTVLALSGGRVVVMRNGAPLVLRDETARLRTAGATLRSETFMDGSSRVTAVPAQGADVVTVRDTNGAMIYRSAGNGSVVLVDDVLTDAAPVDVLALKELARAAIAAPTLAETLAQPPVVAPGRGFSLRAVREVGAVRDLMLAWPVEGVVFDAGDATLSATDAEALADLAQVLQDQIAARPAEMFLIEAHVAAGMDAADALILSDQRATSVALALAEFHDVPPQNLLVQGLGHAQLRLPLQGSDEQNNRVTVRRITPLLSPGG